MGRLLVTKGISFALSVLNLGYRVTGGSSYFKEIAMAVRAGQIVFLPDSTFIVDRIIIPDVYPVEPISTEQFMTNFEEILYG
jgi:hypothetical protein